MTSYLTFLKRYVYTKENIVKLLFMNVCILLISLTSLFIPFFSKSIVDGIMIGSNASSITRIFLIFLSLIFISALIGVIECKYTSELIEKIAMKCRDDIYENLMLNKDELESGQVLFEIFSDVSVICSGSIQLPTNLIITLIILLVANILLYQQNVFSLILINMCLGINIILYSFYYKKMKSLIDKYQSVHSSEYENIKQLVERKPLINAFKTLNQEKYNFNCASERIKKISVEKNRTLLLFSNAFSTLSTILSILVLYIGFMLIKYKNYSLGDVIILNSFLSLLIPYTNKLIDIFNRYPALTISLERVQKDINNNHDNKTNHQKESKQHLTAINKIEFHDLNFSYENKVVFNCFDIKFDIDRFKLILFKGKSGIGKSTLLKMISGQLNVDSMYVNGQQSNQLELKNCIGYYHNSHRIIKGTILENILYGNDIATINDAIQICKIVRIHNVIKDTCDSYYTYIDPNHAAFSSGEEQRICLARTLLQRASVYLLDEPFSNLDLDTAREIIKSLKNHGYKCIIVSHNYDPIDDFDSVIEI